MVSLIVLMLLASVQLCNGDSTVTIRTDGTGTFTDVMTNNIGVAGTYNITFSVKACSDAVAAFSNIMGMANNRGNYFLLMLGTNSNTELTIMDCCFRCSRHKQKKVSLLKCGEFVTFWAAWDGRGYFEVGLGKVLGQNKVLNVTGQYKTYPVNNIAVTSTDTTKATWYFKRHSIPTILAQPVTGGTTLVEVGKLQPHGTDVISVRPAREKNLNQTLNLYLHGNSTDYFYLDGRVIRLKRQLKDAPRPFHFLHVSSNVGLNASLTVLAILQYPDNLTVVVDDVISVEEELPINTLVAWNLTVSDSWGYPLKYSLSGPMAYYFSVTSNGTLYVKNRIDRESINDDVTSGGLVLHVLHVKRNITITINDINDNPPHLGETKSIFRLIEQPYTDMELTRLDVMDKDLPQNGRTNLSVESDSTNSFYVRGTSVFVRAGGLDYEGDSTHMAGVVIKATDMPQSGQPLTSLFPFLVKILPRDEHDPVWASPIPDNASQFPVLLVNTTTPVGTLLTTLSIQDADQGEVVVYKLLQPEGSNSFFQLEKETGDLTLKNKLNESHYNLTIEGISGSKSVTGYLPVSLSAGARRRKRDVKDAGASSSQHNNTQVPKFDKNVYVVDRSTVDQIGSVLRFVVTLSGESAKPLVYIEGDSDTFLLRSRGNDYFLYFKRSRPSKTFPDNIVLKATNPTNNSIFSTARVLFITHLIQCSPVHTLSTSGHIQHTHKPETTTADLQDLPCNTQDSTRENIITIIIITESLSIMALFLSCTDCTGSSSRKRAVRRYRQNNKNTFKMKPLTNRAPRQPPIGCENKNMDREDCTKRKEHSQQAKYDRTQKPVQPPRNTLTISDVDDIELRDVGKEASKTNANSFNPSCSPNKVDDLAAYKLGMDELKKGTNMSSRENQADRKGAIGDPNGLHKEQERPVTESGSKGPTNKPTDFEKDTRRPSFLFNDDAYMNETHSVSAKDNVVI